MLEARSTRQGARLDGAYTYALRVCDIATY